MARPDRILGTMASISAARTASATLALTAVDTVTLSGYSRHVLVENRGTAGTIWVVATGSNSGATVTPADPTAAGANEYAVPPNSTLAVPVSGQWPSADDTHWPLNQVIAKVLGESTNNNPYTVSLV